MKQFIFFFLTMGSLFSIYAQTQDLLNLATGELIAFNIIYNDTDPEGLCNICTKKDDVFGYYTLYNNGEVAENVEEIEYVLLDKNLNSFANGSFKKIIAPYKSRSRLFIYNTSDTITFKNSVYSVANLSYGSGISIYQKLLVKSNEVFPAYVYNKKNKKQKVNIDSIAATLSKRRLKQLDKENDADKVKKDSMTLNKTWFSYNDNKSKLILHRDGKIKRKSITNKKDKSLALRTSNKEVWNVPLKVSSKKEYCFHKPLFLDKKNKNIGVLRYSSDRKKEVSEILIHDINNGNIKSTFLFNTNDDYYYSKDYFNFRNNHLTILSTVKKNSSFRGFNFSRFDVSQKSKSKTKLFLWKDASKFLDIDKKGGVEKGLGLRFLNYFFLQNGNIGLLTEKIRVKPNGKVISTDYVFFMFNKEFDLINAAIIEKDKSKSYNSTIDYLFSQDIEGGSIIFYRDYKKDDNTKDKNWVLGIITYIDGEFGHQTLPMTSDEYSIAPFPAKEGYVLLREFNKEENKYNKIRLEKINY